MKPSLKLFMSSAMITLTLSAPQSVHAMEGSLKTADQTKPLAIQLPRGADHPVEALETQETVQTNPITQSAPIEGEGTNLPDEPNFSSLPPEMQARVFSFLDGKDFLRASHVCRAWRDIVYLAGNNKTLDLSNRKLSQEDYQALLRVPFSALVFRHSLI